MPFPKLIPGENKISETITLDFEQGGKLFGEYGAPTNNGEAGQPTVLKWVGKPNSTMVRLIDCQSQIFDGIQFDAGEIGGVIGVELLFRDKWGCAHQRFNNVTFRNLDIGIKFGSVQSDPCCSDSILDNVHFIDCKRGFVTCNDQSVNHTIRDGGFLRCDRAIDIIKGGNLRVYGGAAGQCDTYLRIAGGGPNAGTFAVRDVRFEASGRSKTDMVLLDSSKAGQSVVEFTGCQCGGANAAGTVNNRGAPLFIKGMWTELKCSGVLQNADYVRPITAKVE